MNIIPLIISTALLSSHAPPGVIDITPKNREAAIASCTGQLVEQGHYGKWVAGYCECIIVAIIITGTPELMAEAKKYEDIDSISPYMLAVNERCIPNIIDL